MSHACVYTLFERSYSFDLWRIVLNVFSFPTLLARATYTSYGGGGREVKRISVNPLFSAPTHGVGEGRGPIFRSIPPVTTYFCYKYYVYSTTHRISVFPNSFKGRLY